MKPRKRYAGWLLLVAVAAIAVGAFLVRRAGRIRDEATREDPPPVRTATTQAAALEPAASAIRTFCSQCHAYVPPASLPRASWRVVIPAMYDSYGRQAHAATGPVPTAQEVLAYYESNAPDKLPYPALEAEPTPAQFHRSAALSVSGVEALGVTHFAIDPRRPKRIFVNDTFGGKMRAVDDTLHEAHELAQLRHPARFEAADLDADGLTDLVVADLGDMYQLDTTRGQVVWLQGRRDGTFAPHVLLSDVGRVADVAIGDIDGDGDLDVATAVFGAVRGSILLLRNDGSQAGVPRFSEHVLDDRPSGVDVEIADVDGDGTKEVLAALSNQYEVVMSYVLHTDGTVASSEIAHADAPTWGSSGIEVADLDADGDLDLLWSHGDTVDAMAVTADQGVHWIENLGNHRFAVRPLVFMAGATATRAADLDRDGDLDIVVVGSLPPAGVTGGRMLAPEHVVSLLWLEQLTGHVFRAHALELDRAQHTAVAVRDVDGDGDLDLLVSEMNGAALDARGTPRVIESTDAWVSSWINDLRK